MVEFSGDAEQAVFRVRPKNLGLGEDLIIGRPGEQRYRCIDLRDLTWPVTIDWSGPDCGAISDGADTLVFQGVDEIILPDCMR